MKKAAVLAVFALIAVVSATRPSIQWTKKCSKEFNISKEMFDNFDPLVSEWHEGSKCYTRCELLAQRVFAEDSYHNTHFNRDFSRAIGNRARYKDPAIKAGAEVLANCIGQNSASEGCEKAYQFAKCIAGTVVTADFLQQFITNYAI